MNKRKSIAKQQDKKGIYFSLVDNGDGTFAVYKLCENYCGQIKGGIRKTWRYVVNNVTKDEAKKVFYKRIGWKKIPKVSG